MGNKRIKKRRDFRIIIHYCSIEQANESDNNEYYSKSACGLEYFEHGNDNPKLVTCKDCLRVLTKRKKETFRS